ncbi:tripartite tricarboxylate transporter substrate binding protein [Cupriavidus pauculus]|uniref:LacI family transcriptional regulator n=1 Tax=Cupriavidus pauculus TaxID=82633 RepID=A0A2N5C7K4_9BURK|nr:tripartite tricarboxylate transporter substrate binding protein [Cupriavidus pauculus]PLP98189.1 LacI family transcriptional regulator [Cupriavidus pauculus]
MAVTATPAHATYPDKPIRIVVPFSPGGGTDLIARAMGVAMAQDLGQPVVIDNKPGGGTIIGTDNVAKSAADGYTLVMATFAHAVNPSLQPKLPYDTEKAFTPVMLVGRSPNVLVVRADSPYKSVRDVIAAAKAKPGAISFASQGPGTSAHLAGELFKSLAKVDLNHIPYKGAGPAITDLLGGQVDMMFATASAVGNLLEAGKLRALGVTTSQRSTSPDLAKVPTIAESGVPGYAAESWYGLFAPAGTPPAVVTRLNAAARKAVTADAFRKRADAEGLIVSPGTPDDFGRYVRGEETRWSKVVKDARITLN